MSGVGLLAQVKSEPDPTQAFADAIPAMAPGSTVEPVEEPAAPPPSAAALAVRPVLTNVVCTFLLGCDEIDLKHVANLMRNAKGLNWEYNPKRFPAIVVRLKEPAKTTGLYFPSGKVVCTGAQTEEHCRMACRKYVKLLQTIAPRYRRAKCDNVRIHNLVGTGKMGWEVDLERMAYENRGECTFEPELFAGLIYRVAAGETSRTKLKCFIFYSGKVVISGAKSRQQLNTAFEELLPIVEPFRRHHHSVADTRECTA